MISLQIRCFIQIKSGESDKGPDLYRLPSSQESRKAILFLYCERRIYLVGTHMCSSWIAVSADGTGVVDSFSFGRDVSYTVETNIFLEAEIYHNFQNESNYITSSCGNNTKSMNNFRVIWTRSHPISILKLS